MRDLIILFVHIIATLARLLGPGGIRSVVAESVLIKQQLLILNRSGNDWPCSSSGERSCPSIRTSWADGAPPSARAVANRSIVLASSLVTAG